MNEEPEVRARLQFTGEGFGEDGGHQGVEFFGGFLLQFFYGVNHRSQIVEVRDDAALFGKGWNWNVESP